MKKLIVALNSQPNIFHTGLLVAKANNWFSEFGLDVEIQLPDNRTFLDSSPMKVATGQAHIGLTSPEILFAFHAHKCSVPLLALSAPIQHNFKQYACLEKSRIKGFGDFGGKRFAAKGTYGQLEELRYLLNREGVSGMIRPVDAYESEAIQKDTADIFYLNKAWEGLYLEMQGYKINYFPKTEMDLVNGYNPVYITHPDLLKKYPKHIKDFFYCLDKGYHLAAKQPNQVAQLFYNNYSDQYLYFNNKEFLIQVLKMVSKSFLNENEMWGVMSEYIWQEFMLYLKRIAKETDYCKSDHIKPSCDYAAKLFTNSCLPYQLVS